VLIDHQGLILSDSDLTVLGSSDENGGLVAGLVRAFGLNDLFFSISELSLFDSNGGALSLGDGFGSEFNEFFGDVLGRDERGGDSSDRAGGNSHGLDFNLLFNDLDGSFSGSNISDDVGSVFLDLNLDSGLLLLGVFDNESHKLTGSVDLGLGFDDNGSDQERLFFLENRENGDDFIISGLNGNNGKRDGLDHLGFFLNDLNVSESDFFGFLDNGD